MSPIHLPEQTNYAADVSACMNARGWSATATYDNGLTQNSMIKTADLGDYDADVAACEANLDDELQPALTDELISEYFQVESAARRCLIHVGYRLPPMPSLDDYRETFGTSDMYDLTSLVTIENVTLAEDVFATCKPAQWFPPKVPRSGT